MAKTLYFTTHFGKEFPLVLGEEDHVFRQGYDILLHIYYYI